METTWRTELEETQDELSRFLQICSGWGGSQKCNQRAFSSSFFFFEWCIHFKPAPLSVSDSDTNIGLKSVLSLSGEKEMMFTFQQVLKHTVTATALGRSTADSRKLIALVVYFRWNFNWVGSGVLFFSLNFWWSINVIIPYTWPCPETKTSKGP